MKYKRAALIVPPYPGSRYHRDQVLFSGIGYIFETLSKHGVENILVDLQGTELTEQTIQRLIDFRPDFIGCSMMTFKYRASYDVLEHLKRLLPGADIIVGGPHVSTLRETVLDECPAIDYGVVLEGERTIIELCQGQEPATIQGLLYRGSEGKAVYTGDRPFIENLDEVPFPRFQAFNASHYTSGFPIVTSRGCPCSCIYCPVPLAIGKRFRVHSACTVVDQIEFGLEHGWRQFDILDDNFTLIPDHVEGICAEIERRKLTGLQLSCGNGVRADRVHRKLLARMREVGFFSLAFGVEAGNDKILANLKKGERMSTIKQAIGDACDLGYSVQLFFLVGSPGETWSDVEDSVNLALSFPVVQAPFYNIIPFPNTELFRWVEKNGYFLRSPEEYLNDASAWLNEPVFETPELPLAERRRAWRYANKVVGEHCRRNSRRITQQKIENRLRLRPPLSTFGAKVWCSKVVQDGLLRIPSVQRWREKFMGRSVGSRW